MAWVEKFRTVEVTPTNIANQYRVKVVATVTDGVAITTVANTQTLTLPMTSLAANTTEAADVLDTAQGLLDSIVATLP